MFLVQTTPTYICQLEKAKGGGISQSKSPGGGVASLWPPIYLGSYWILMADFFRDEIFCKNVNIFCIHFLGWIINLFLGGTNLIWERYPYEKLQYLYFNEVPGSQAYIFSNRNLCKKLPYFTSAPPRPLRVKKLSGRGVARRGGYGCAPPPWVIPKYILNNENILIIFYKFKYILIYCISRLL